MEDREEKCPLTRFKKKRKHEMQAGVFFKWWLNKAHSVKRRESLRQVTFTAVKQSTDGLGAHWAMRWQLELNGGRKRSGEYIGT